MWGRGMFVETVPASYSSKGIGFCPDTWITLARTSNSEPEMETLRNHLAFISW